MNRDELIHMARAAGAFPELSETPEKDVDFLRRFAALVAAAEREACAKVVENYALGYHEPTWAFKLIAAIRARGQA